MKKIIITNASSPLGINLARALLEDKNTLIYAYDNELSRNTPSLYSLLKEDRYYFCEQSLKKTIEQTVDEIYHLESILSKNRYILSKCEYIINQIEILKNILYYTSKTGSKLVFVCNFQDYKPTNREYFPYYDTLQMMKSLISEYSNERKIYYKIAQISDFYGINSIPDKNNFVGEYIVKSFNNEEITIEQNESLYLTNVLDIVSGLKALTARYTDSNIFDISSSQLCLKTDILKLIMNFTKSNSIVKVKDETIITPAYTPDTINAENELDFKCKTTLLDGISKTIDFYKLMYFS